MQYQIGYYIILTIIAFLGVYCSWFTFTNSKASNNVRFKRNRLKEISNKLKDRFESEETTKVFRQTGLSISVFSYQAIRYCLGVTFLAIILYSRFLTGKFLHNQFLFLLIAFFVSTPKMKIFGIDTPFGILIKFFTDEFKKKKNKEVFRAVGQLKNLSIAKADVALGSDYILNELMKFTKVTKPIFCKMLSLWYEADQKIACEYFADTIGTKESRDLANIFLKLDSLNAGELREQLIMFQHGVNQEKQRQKEIHNENRGYFIYGFVIISVMIVLIDFITIVLFTDNLNFIKNLQFLKQ